MKKLVLVFLLVVSGVAFAQGSAAQPSPGEPPAAQPAPPPEPPTASESPARKACVDAMNQDPAFAKSIADTVDKQLDQKTIDQHEDAARHIQKNEKHVIYSYAAMWIIAALLVAFLWLRQQALKAEIAQLRKDLDAAAKENA